MTKRSKDFLIWREVPTENKDVRDAVDLTLKHCKEFWAEDANKINGRYVLITGYSIGCSERIKDMIKLLKQCYSPKSVTVLKIAAREERKGL